MQRRLAEKPGKTQDSKELKLESDLDLGLDTEDAEDTDSSAKPPVLRVLSKDMLQKTVDQINDNDTFQLGFARKHIISEIPLTHSAAAFLDVTPKHDPKWLIFGRQTPFFLKEEHAADYVGGLSHLISNLTDSKIDNEKRYNFFRGQNFLAEMSPVTFTGAEIKRIIIDANRRICETQRFDLVYSNCYSASVSMLTNAIEVIAERPEHNPAEKAKNDKDIQAIYKLIQNAADDNLSIGVANQPLVQDAIKQVEKIIQKRKTETELSAASHSNTTPLRIAVSRSPKTELSSTEAKSTRMEKSKHSHLKSSEFSEKKHGEKRRSRSHK